MRSSQTTTRKTAHDLHQQPRLLAGLPQEMRLIVLYMGTIALHTPLHRSKMIRHHI